jgi:hypothetical protein
VKRALVVLAVAACSGRRPIASCEDDLRGVYRDGEQRWMVLDRDTRLEAYPLFPDVPPQAADSEIIAAPRVIDLERGLRGAETIAGTLHRRYQRRNRTCDAHISVHITSCHDDTLTWVLSDPEPPLRFVPCTSARPEPSRVVHWQRE